MGKKTSILLIDDHQLLRTGIKQIIESDHLFKVVAESNGKESLLHLIEKHNPKIILMDINLRFVHWQEAIQDIKSKFPEIKVIILTFSEDKKSVIEAVELGIHGYLLKSMGRESLVKMIQHINGGGTYIHHRVIHYVIKDYKDLLSDRTSEPVKVSYEMPLHILSRRECQVLQLLANGNSNKSIARILGISQSTCKNHVNSILKKMNVKDRTHAVVTAIRNGWVELETVNPPLSS